MGGSEIAELIRNFGGHPNGAILTLGRYDMAEIAELPDDEPAFKLTMKSSEYRLLKVETLRTFDEREILRILS